MLYVVGTPIGNLDDISVRALRTLENADLIAAEDTRHTLGLLTHFGIKKPLVSYFEHNKISRGNEIIGKLKEGADVALVSDAGMPGICDPGYELIRDCIENGIGVTVIPGACACVSALVLSGLPSDGFVFAGFIPRENKKRAAFFEVLAAETRTTVCYEAPHRVVKTLGDISGLFAGRGTPGRRLAVCRELTKTHEEVLRGTAEELLAHFAGAGPKGEFVFCIEGASESADGTPERGSGSCSPDCRDGFSEDAVRAAYEQLTASGTSPKEAMKTAQTRFGLSRNEIYRIVRLSGKEI